MDSWHSISGDWVVMIWLADYVQWIPELQHYAPGVPVVLAGTKLGK